MDAPDELVEAALDAIEAARGVLDVDTDGIPESQWRVLADAVLAVPAIADALRAAEEEEVYRTALGLACSDGWSDGQSAMESYIETAKAHIAALRAITAAS